MFFLVAEKLERSNGLTIVFGFVSFYFVIVNLIDQQLKTWTQILGLAMDPQQYYLLYPGSIQPVLVVDLFLIE